MDTSTEPRTIARTLSLIVRNLVFTVVVPGLGGVWVPWRIATGHGSHGIDVAAAGWAAVPVIAAGTALYAWCVWNFAAVGRGTPGPWDAPARVVAASPYRWVRNPIYLAALLVVLGEAWLFMSLWLLAYAGLMAVFFHLFVTGYEERTLRRRFGPSYLEYQRTVPRWVPRPPRRRDRLPEEPKVAQARDSVTCPAPSISPWKDPHLPERTVVPVPAPDSAPPGPSLSPALLDDLRGLPLTMSDLGPGGQGPRILADRSRVGLPGGSQPKDVISMRALVVYESMYGNTRVVAGHVADGLRPTHEVTIVPVSQATEELVAGADLLVVGGPTHMHGVSSAASRRMAVRGGRERAARCGWTRTRSEPGLRDWFGGIAPGHVLAAAFDTRINARSVFTGRASRGIRRLLKQHGYHVIAAPESFLVTSRNALLGGEAARARRWGAALGVIASDVKHPAHA